MTEYELMTGAYIILAFIVGAIVGFIVGQEL